MLKPGLVSITFRKLSPAEIVNLAARAGIESIEWGGDVHVPHGDVTRARQVRDLTRDHGITTAAYGSYYHAGEHLDFSFADVLTTAVELGAPVIRVWAGKQGSAQATPAYRAHVAEDLHRVVSLAAECGIRVALEFHGGTLTDNTESALAIHAAADQANLGLYWQPPCGWTETQLLRSLRQVLPLLVNLHVFHWQNDGVRCPLAAGQGRWRSWLEVVRPVAVKQEVHALLEFVKDDAPAQFLQDAQSLRQLLDI